MPRRSPDGLTATLGACLLLLSALTGCREPCFDEPAKGSTYSATIAGPYGSGTSFPGPLPFTTGRPPCQGFDGLERGDRVTILATEHFEAVSCDTLVGRIVEAPGGVTLEAPGTVPAAGISLAAGSVVSAGGCHGLWVVDLVRPVGTQDIFAEPMEGRTPSMVMLRLFDPDVESDKCKRCEDYFAVKFEKR